MSSWANLSMRNAWSISCYPFCLLILLLSLFPRHALAVPAGFEFLLEKQTTAVDVFYGGVYVATTLANYTPTTVEFSEPEAIVSKLDNLLDPAAIRLALTGELDANLDAICYRREDKKCGRLSPDVAGVIFEEGRFRVDVFVNRDLISVQEAEITKYLPPSSTELSYLNNLTFLAAGDDQDNQNFAFTGISFLSKENTRGIAKWALEKRGDAKARLSATELYFEKDFTDYQFRTGWFTSDTRFMTFGPSVELFGVHYSTSLKARTDLEFSTGTQIQVFLVNRSRVDIFRDDKIVASNFYESGNQILDTSSLPDGSYDIDIVVIGPSGEEDRVKRRFVKTARIAPADRDLFFIEVGDIRIRSNEGFLPKSTGKPLVQAGYSRRIRENLGWSAGAAIESDDTIVETGLYFVHQMFDFEPKLLAGVKGDYGYLLRGYGRYGRLSGNYSYQRIWSDNVRNFAKDDIDIIPDDQKQFILSLNYTLFEQHLSFRHTLTDFQDTGKTEIYSLALSGHLPFEFYEGRFNYRSEIAWSNDDTLATIGVDWTWRDRHWQHRPKLKVSYEDTDDRNKETYGKLAYDGSWTYQNKDYDDMRVNWNLDVDDRVLQASIGGTYSNELGEARVDLGHFDNGVTTSNQFSGKLTTSIAGEEGRWGVGGKRSASSAIVITVEGTDESKYFDIHINNARYTTLQVGQQIVVPLAPYRSYDINIKDIGTEFVSFEKSHRSITLYPGNVKSITWRARNVGVVIARILREIPGCIGTTNNACIEPLVYTRVEGANGYAATGPDGFLQAELYEGHKKLIMVRSHYQCSVELPELVFESGVAFIDDELFCKPEP